MKHIKLYLKQFFAEDNGATATEYAVVIAFIAIAIMAAVTVFGQAVAAWFTGTAPTVGGLPTN